MTTSKSEERKENIKKYREEIPEFIIHTNDELNAMGHFVQICDEFKNEEEGILFIEDDLKLCTGFLEKTKAIVEKNKEKVIQFFDMKKDSFEGLREQRGSSFCGTVCVYIPSRILKQIPCYSGLYSCKYPQHPTAYDYLLGFTLSQMKEKYFIYRPSLVQHLPIKSVINPKRSTGRKSLHFIEG